MKIPIILFAELLSCMALHAQNPPPSQKPDTTKQMQNKDKSVDTLQKQQPQKGDTVRVSPYPNQNYPPKSTAKPLPPVNPN